MNPVCVPCARFFKPKKTGFYFIEAMPRHNDVAPGYAQADMWAPYKLWVGDLYECEECGAQTIVGVGREPITEHYKPDFEDTAARLGAHQFHVNDC